MLANSPKKQKQKQEPPRPGRQLQSSSNLISTPIVPQKPNYLQILEHLADAIDPHTTDPDAIDALVEYGDDLERVVLDALALADPSVSDVLAVLAECSAPEGGAR